MRLIDREELKLKLDRGEDFKLVMVLGEWAYRAKHIPGSLNLDTIEKALEAPRYERRDRGLLLQPRLHRQRGRFQDAHAERLRQRPAIRGRARGLGGSRLPPRRGDGPVSEASNRKVKERR
jgi:hypothetical protein